MPVVLTDMVASRHHGNRDLMTATRRRAREEEERFRQWLERRRTRLVVDPLAGCGGLTWAEKAAAEAESQHRAESEWRLRVDGEDASG